MNEGERLSATVEGIRASDFPELDPDLVQQILTAQIQMQEDRAEGQRQTNQAIARWAAANAPKDSEDAPG